MLVRDGVQTLGPDHPTLSAALICLNEERDLPSCLATLVDWCDEIVVALDSGTTDKTAEVAKSYGARVVFNEWRGWAAQKNFVFSQCRSDWILSIDADERIPETLRQEMVGVIASPAASEGYFVARKNMWLGRWIQHGGWYPDHTLRLFRRGVGAARYIAHERIEVTGATGILKEPLIHDNIQSIDEHMWTSLRSTNAEVDEMLANGLRFYWLLPFGPIIEYVRRLSSGPFTRLRAYLLAKDVFKNRAVVIWAIPFLPFTKFAHMYIVKRGFRDGMHGFVVACLSSIYVVLKYAKYWERVHGRPTVMTGPPN